MPMRRATRAALLAFALSRLLFFALVIAGSNTAFVRKVYSGRIWETNIVLQRARIVPGIIITVMNGDAWWYRSIALHGYEHRRFSATPAANWAFFPLYPLIVRSLGAGGDFAIDGMLVSHVAFFGALLLLFLVTVGGGGTEEDAERATFYLAFFPTSYFFSLPLPESLFLLLTLAAFFAAQRDKWWLAGLVGGLAASTRAAGLMLLPALFFLAIERRSWRRAVPWLFVIPAGTGAFMLYLYRLTGNALAFAGVQGNWSRHPTPFWTPVVAFLRKPYAIGEPWNFIGLNFIAVLLVAAAACWFLASRRWALGAYALLSLLLPLTAGSLQSISRYAVVIFPVFIALATFGRRSAIDRTILAISATLFGWLVALFVLRIDFALA
jgi:hypothetical protein